VLRLSYVKSITSMAFVHIKQKLRVFCNNNFLHSLVLHAKTSVVRYCHILRPELHILYSKYSTDKNASKITVLVIVPLTAKSTVNANLLTYDCLELQ
jgi:hypothetical protein